MFSNNNNFDKNSSENKTVSTALEKMSQEKPSVKDPSLEEKPKKDSINESSKFDFLSYARSLKGKYLSEEDTMSSDGEPNDRKDNPQIDNHDEMVNDLTSNGIIHNLESFVPNTYVSSQKNVNQDKVNGLLSLLQGGKVVHPPVVSRDNVIIDGHHRSLAIEKHIKNDKSYVPKAFKINLNYDQFRDFIKDKPYVKHKK